MASKVTSDQYQDCKHVFLTQNSLPIPPLFLGQRDQPSLPPIYINLATPIKPSTLETYMTAAQSHFLNHPRPRGSFVSHSVKALREELAQGMIRARREQMTIYVRSLPDPKERAAAELYLACYPGFFLNGEEALDLDLDCGVLTSSDECASAEPGSLWRYHGDKDMKIQEQKKAWFKEDDESSDAELEIELQKRMSGSEETLVKGRKDNWKMAFKLCTIM